MQYNASPQRATVNKHGLWARYAEAQQLAIKGDQLIAQAIADSIRGLWRRVMR